MYYLSSENKGADQLRGYREADLRLCFRLCRLLVFSCGCSFILLAYNHSASMANKLSIIKMSAFILIFKHLTFFSETKKKKMLIVISFPGSNR